MRGPGSWTLRRRPNAASVLAEPTAQVRQEAGKRLWVGSQEYESSRRPSWPVSLTSADRYNGRLLACICWYRKSFVRHASAPSLVHLPFPCKSQRPPSHLPHAHVGRFQEGPAPRVPGRLQRAVEGGGRHAVLAAQRVAVVGAVQPQHAQLAAGAGGGIGAVCGRTAPPAVRRHACPATGGLHLHLHCALWFLTVVKLTIYCIGRRGSARAAHCMTQDRSQGNLYESGSNRWVFALAAAGSGWHLKVYVGILH